MIPDPHPNFSWLRFNLYLICVNVWVMIFGFALEQVFGEHPSAFETVGIVVFVAGFTYMLTAKLTEYGWFRKP